MKSFLSRRRGFTPLRPDGLRRGFTLIELLLVIGIIAILASIVIIAVNPTKQLGKARNAQRRSDVNTILNAVYQYAIDHNGILPPAISAISKEICNTDVANVQDRTNCDNTAGAGGTVYNNSTSLWLLSGAYLVDIPHDPSAPATATGTRYLIKSDINTSRITVSAPGAENGEVITVTR